MSAGMGLAAMACMAAGAERGVVLSPGYRSRPPVPEGELLLGELGCTACHTANAAASERLFPRQAPVLEGIGSRITPTYLRRFLSDPHKTKPGTPMPDLLHGLSSPAREESVEALVHFLGSLVSPNAQPSPGVSPHLIQTGNVLYHTVGCVACHAPQEPSRNGSADAVATLQGDSVPLGDLARKTTLEELARFLMDPLKTRPSGRMPSLNLARGEAVSIAAYLLREQAVSGVKGPQVRMPGLQYEYFEKLVHNTSGIDEAAPTESGTIEQFSLSPKKRNEQIAFRYTGILKVPKDDLYTFFLVSDDGSRLWIDGRLVVDDDGVHAPTEKSGKLELKAGDHTIAVSFFNEYAGGELAVTWQPQGMPRKPIPASLLSHEGRSMLPVDAGELTVDPAKAARGRELFASLGCAACHELTPGERLASGLKAPPLGSLAASKSGGCLATPRAGVPRFALSTSQEAALRDAVAGAASPVGPAEAGAGVLHRMTALNCLACHVRDGFGGPSEARADYFTTVDNADLGDEGRIPPHLNRVGDKLRKEWVRKVLLQKGAVRPYIATRMPQFGASVVGTLPDAFEKADASPSSPAPSPSAQDAKFGRQLVGTGGVSCIACHMFGGHKSLGIPAIDLTTVPERLKREWFVRYLPDPAALRPGTRMPSFWPEGKAANRDILGGSTQRQLEAIWAYLSEGKGAKLPEGLIPVEIELTPATEPLVYRHFIEGAGSRAIAVGYPEKAHLAWDANNLRLALIWHGKFMDAGKHRRDRGAGYEGPLGDDLLKLPDGAPFAALPALTRPWPGDAGKAAGYQMKGYRLDEHRRPIFLYTFDGISVEDHPVPVPREPEPGFVRRLSLKSDTVLPALWFRAAMGNTIEPVGDGFRVDGRLTLKFKLPGGARPEVRRISGKQELLVPVKTNENHFEIEEELTW
jgi:cytochrome c2